MLGCLKESGLKDSDWPRKVHSITQSSQNSTQREEKIGPDYSFHNCSSGNLSFVRRMIESVRKDYSELLQEGKLFCVMWRWHWRLWRPIMIHSHHFPTWTVKHSMILLTRIPVFRLQKNSQTEIIESVLERKWPRQEEEAADDVELLPVMPFMSKTRPNE